MSDKIAVQQSRLHYHLIYNYLNVSKLQVVFHPLKSFVNIRFSGIFVFDYSGIMSGKKNKEKKFIVTPEFRGGNAALRKFIDAHLRYPEEALKHQVSGTVYLSYTVTNEGNVEDIIVKKGIGYGCDEEAVRVISLLKYEPAHNRGVKVRSTLRTRIVFRLPFSLSPVITYTVVPDAEKQKPAAKPAGNNGYGYSIVIGNTRKD